MEIAITMYFVATISASIALFYGFYKSLIEPWAKDIEERKKILQDKKLKK